ncbi:MAG: 30S ribosomal protein S15 [Candidatus Collierbacteria bacterium GW2011_GWC1_45_47]|uniref:Small ribosomal subunit protein uS15 n=5 Tax=Candidatus Collieribacteriota TaxID=1752725 RepID=A0A0G1HHK8_9BACT|nr:MAG: 30S ribosomal protein S15 [Candidatus Collierbacteria bacterium GW2011_GWA1_44_12]KKT39473.1 MAG: 30S ribosomal protein S15 [Candidatus Collierbacteria bacterium GW2011_GWF1_44_12]KKT46073.1 MAG: 30S ribosomal protein S15 [Candidatus Collierbacteria bacterium GW2011_GWF2_44_15]KKT99626.1 MAG: 30S ribosomal protein S15 [Candidatus Collierbacteria bacterium GW2011_GWC2_45_15]KKU09448.1 MAG: 30S ribosomal protein S15 [Candidatus Collierbacteria bacterium GW2011_GWC1_45_47]KKU28715.1 MAG: 
MALKSDTKIDIIKKFAASEKDTGSPRVQIALLTSQIDELTNHLKVHKKDNHSRRGLLKIISKRRRLLNYLGKSNPTDYLDITKTLKISSQLRDSAK